MANVKRQCPVCLQKDQAYHDDSLGGDAVVQTQTSPAKYACTSCGYDASMDKDWIVETE